jgi:hypothetical protein
MEHAISMPSRAPLPSSFDLLVDELFGRDDRPAGVPRTNRISIDSLEAAWALAAHTRGATNDQTVCRTQPYSSEVNDGETEPLLDPNRILIELGLDANLSEVDIAILRRAFALRNHPDRVMPELRELATQRMMIANDLMDRYVARLRKAVG